MAGHKKRDGKQPNIYLCRGWNNGDQTHYSVRHAGRADFFGAGLYV
jgi:hypothetical protein